MKIVGVNELKAGGPEGDNEHNRCHRTLGCPVIAFTTNNDAAIDGHGIDSCSTPPDDADLEQIEIEIGEEEAEVEDEYDVVGDPNLNIEILQQILEKASGFPRCINVKTGKLDERQDKYTKWVKGRQTYFVKFIR